MTCLASCKKGVSKVMLDMGLWNRLEGYRLQDLREDTGACSPRVGDLSSTWAPNSIFNL